MRHRRPAPIYRHGSGSWVDVRAWSRLVKNRLIHANGGKVPCTCTLEHVRHAPHERTCLHYAPAVRCRECGAERYFYGHHLWCKHVALWTR